MAKLTDTGILTQVSIRLLTTAPISGGGTNEAPVVHKEYVQILESIVIHWTSQIQRMLLITMIVALILKQVGLWRRLNSGRAALRIYWNYKSNLDRPMSKDGECFGTFKK